MEADVSRRQPKSVCLHCIVDVGATLVIRQLHYLPVSIAHRLLCRYDPLIVQWPFPAQNTSHCFFTRLNRKSGVTRGCNGNCLVLPGASQKGRQDSSVARAPFCFMPKYYNCSQMLNSPRSMRLYFCVSACYEFTFSSTGHFLNLHFTHILTQFHS